MNFNNVFLFVVFILFTFTIPFVYDVAYFAYGIVDPLFPKELLTQSETIIVGNITSKTIVPLEYSSDEFSGTDDVVKNTEGFTKYVEEYVINITDFLKNPQDLDVITVREPLVSTGSYPSTLGARFDVGDHVLLYLDELDEINEYRFESFAFPESCNAQDVLMQERLWFTEQEFIIMQNDIQFDGYKKKEFQNLTASEPVRFVYGHDMETLTGKGFDIEIEIIREESGSSDHIILNQTLRVESQPCEWIGYAEWEFIPSEGIYRITGHSKNTANGESFYDERIIGSTIFVSFDTNKSVLSPLKQFTSNVPFNEIKCEGNLILIQKYDDSPACVKPETAIKLIERGWTKPI